VLVTDETIKVLSVSQKEEGPPPLPAAGRCRELLKKSEKVEGKR
jgi:hypothetical protein